MKRKTFSERLSVKGTAVVAMVSMLMLLAVWRPVSAAPPAQGGGETIFQQKCSTCHTIGGGPLVGPDLQGVTSERDADWLTRWISAPDKMLADGDPIATDLLRQFNNVPMPNLGLSDAEVAAVIAYLSPQNTTVAPTADAQMPQTGASAAVAPAASEPKLLPEGNLESGKRLFVGETQLQNGGPACISCHSVDSLEPLGGGSLGPNLTHVYSRYGEAGLSAVLTGLPFPTMRGVFADKPLTESEAADLKEFFYQTNLTKNAAPINTIWFVVIGVFGVMFFLIIAQIIWIERLDGVRKPLIGR